jgi:DNA-binding MarR family transcriptional regulator
MSRDAQPKSAQPKSAQSKSDQSRSDQSKSEICNCLALRQATRHVTQFYDRFLASSGLRTTQFSILARLRLAGPLPINALAKRMVMDRTTLGRNILPLEREGLIEIVPDPADGRSKVVRLTEAGAARLRAARAGWTQAQKKFEAAFGGARAARLRDLLHAVIATELGAAAGAG